MGKSTTLEGRGQPLTGLRPLKTTSKKTPVDGHRDVTIAAERLAAAAPWVMTLALGASGAESESPGPTESQVCLCASITPVLGTGTQRQVDPQSLLNSTLTKMVSSWFSERLYVKVIRDTWRKEDTHGSELYIHTAATTHTHTHTHSKHTLYYAHTIPHYIHTKHYTHNTYTIPHKTLTLHKHMLHITLYTTHTHHTTLHTQNTTLYYIHTTHIHTILHYTHTKHYTAHSDIHSHTHTHSLGGCERV